jgi:hypothetical protein
MLELLDLMHRVFRSIHIAVGVLGLLLFWVPVFAAKGGRLHIRCGRIFSYAAYFVSVTGLISSVWCLSHTRSFIGTRWAEFSGDRIPYVLEEFRFMFSILGFLSLAVLCGVAFGVRVVRTRGNHAALRCRWLLGTQTAFGLWSLGLATFGAINLVMIYTGRHLLPVEASGRYWIPVALGVFGLFGASGDVAYVLKPRPSPMAWWYKHMENMLGVGIAFHTAFLVFGVGRLLPFRLEGAWQLLPWVLPAVIGIPATHLWIRQYKQRFGELQSKDQPTSIAAAIVPNSHQPIGTGAASDPPAVERAGD